MSHGSDRISIRYTLFGSLAKGGYMRVFESESHPGITGMIKAETRKSQEITTFIYQDKEYSTVKDVLAAYKAAPPLTENKIR